MSIITLNDLKSRAIAEGCNLQAGDFSARDWPNLQGFLSFRYGIQAEYGAVIRDVVSGAVTPFNPSFRFKNKTTERPVAYHYSYGTILVHAGLNLHKTELVDIESNATVEIAINGKWTPVTQFSYTYELPDSELPFRFMPQQTGNSIKFKTDTFTSVYLFVAIPFKEKDRTPAVCAKAICGLTIVGDDT